jgi:hypothetical protein
VTDDNLKAREALAIAIAEAAKAGRWDVVERLSAQIETLHSGLTSSGHVDQDVPKMTSAQLERRGRAVAAAKADSSLKKAIVERYGSMTKAAKAYRVSKQSLSAYELGERPVPRRIDERVRADFPGLSWEWPGGVVD